MWKVKRMNTARIVVLTIAVGAGGIAACPAAGSDNMPVPAHGATADHRFITTAHPDGLLATPIQMSAAASAGEMALQDAAARNGVSRPGRDTEVTERTPI